MILMIRGFHGPMNDRKYPPPKDRVVGPLPNGHFMAYMGVSKNGGTPKSSIFIGFSIINHPFWDTPIFGNTHINGGDPNYLLAGMILQVMLILRT